MIAPLATESDLAEALGLSVEKIRELRKTRKWPHVRLTRFDVRFTEEHVEQIVAKHTVETRDLGPAPTVAGQTAASRRRSA